MKPARVIFFEIPVIKPAISLDFYRKVFGWQFSRLEDQSYWLAKTGPDQLPGINGAITRKSNFNQQTIITLQVENLDETILALEAQRGEVISEELLLPGIGRTIYFKAPEGCTFKALQVSSPDKREISKL